MKKLPKIINQEEFEKIFKATHQGKARLKKDKAVAMLLGFEAGMRISEIIGLPGRVPALTPDRVEDAQIRIESGKGGKDRIVPRPKRFNAACVAMLPLKVQRRALQAHTTNIGKKLLGKHITFHTMRHGFGSHLAGLNMPLHQIQMLMGHSRLDTTGIYLHANPKEAIDGARELF